LLIPSWAAADARWRTLIAANWQPSVGMLNFF